jgi:membrane dipeptidase
MTSRTPHPETAAADLRARALALHRAVPLVDGHNDLAWQVWQKAQRVLSRIDLRRPQPELHTDIARLRAGGLGGQIWSVYVPATLQGADAVRATVEQIDVVHKLLGRYPDTFELALTAGELETAFRAGKIASLIGMEGGHSIGDSLGTLRMFFRLGARAMTLTHSSSISWAESTTGEPSPAGLSHFGIEVVREMNRLGMMVDLSHVSERAMHAALDAAEAPVIFSHSGARAVCDHPRNVPDGVLRRIPRNGGIVMATFVPKFVSSALHEHDLRRRAEGERLRRLAGSTPASLAEGLRGWDVAHPPPRARLTEVADHVDHLREVAGIDHIGIGSDFDGISSVPEGLEDVSKYPDLTVELLRRGYSDEDLLKILGRNFLRAFTSVEQVARRLDRERGPSEARIEEVDGPGR